MYADKETDAMRKAIQETDRRRAIQIAYNEKHGITPETIQKGISDITDFPRSSPSSRPGRGGNRCRQTEGMMPEEIRRTMVELEEEMLAAPTTSAGVRREAARRDQGLAPRARRDRSRIRARLLPGSL